MLPGKAHIILDSTTVRLRKVAIFDVIGNTVQPGKFLQVS